MFNTRQRTPWRSLLPRNSPRAPSRNLPSMTPHLPCPWQLCQADLALLTDIRPPSVPVIGRCRRFHAKPAIGATTWQLPHNTPADASRFRKANGHRHQADGHWCSLLQLSFTINAPQDLELRFRPVGPLLADWRRPCHIWPSCRAALFVGYPGTERPAPDCPSPAATPHQ